VLRTKPSVDLTVLYGSAAGGSEQVRSGMDTLVDFRDDAQVSGRYSDSRARTGALLTATSVVVSFLGARALTTCHL
jgi:hypothetical protein